MSYDVQFAVYMTRITFYLDIRVRSMKMELQYRTNFIRTNLILQCYITEYKQECTCNLLRKNAEITILQKYYKCVFTILQGLKNSSTIFFQEQGAAVRKMRNCILRLSNRKIGKLPFFSPHSQGWEIQLFDAPQIEKSRGHRP